MKALLVIITLVLAQNVKANNCFNNKEVIEAIEAAAALDECFESDDKPCLRNASVEDEVQINSFRLAPYDTTSGDGFMEKATGTIAFKVNARDALIANATKVSRCHIVTSAHNAFKFGLVPVQSENVNLGFKSGDYCDKDRVSDATSSRIQFRMVEEGNGKDFVCVQKDKYGNCEVRQFYGKSDVVVVKLSKFDKNDRNFFSVNSKGLSGYKIGEKLTCWGYVNGRFFMQKNAQIFGNNNGKSDRGYITNMAAIPGMSGGGCAFASKPRELVAIINNQNSVSGISRVKIDPSNPVDSEANYLTDLSELDKRMYAKTGKRLADLDSECN